jgi:hypothetical protein
MEDTSTSTRAATAKKAAKKNAPTKKVAAKKTPAEELAEVIVEAVTDASIKERLRLTKNLKRVAAGLATGFLRAVNEALEGK